MALNSLSAKVTAPTSSPLLMSSFRAWWKVTRILSLWVLPNLETVAWFFQLCDGVEGFFLCSIQNCNWCKSQVSSPAFLPVCKISLSILPCPIQFLSLLHCHGIQTPKPLNAIIPSNGVFFFFFPANAHIATEIPTLHRN